MILADLDREMFDLHVHEEVSRRVMKIWMMRADELERRQEIIEARALLRKERLAALRRLVAQPNDPDPWPESGRRMSTNTVTSSTRQSLGAMAKWPRVCRLCDAATEWRDLVLDHDHDTRLTRGFICTRCNVLLGVIEGRGRALTGTRHETWLRAAERYLRVAAEGWKQKHNHVDQVEVDSEDLRMIVA